MHYLPMDVNTTEPSAGGGSAYPEGVYLMEMVDATESRKERKGNHERLIYKAKILMGPGWNQQLAGKPYTFGYRKGVDELGNDWNPRHMACKQAAAQYNGYLPGELLTGRPFIIELSVDGRFNREARILPYTQEAWAEEVGGAPQQPVGPAPMTPQPPAVAPPAPPVAAPPAPVAPPAAVAPQMPTAPPAPPAPPAAPAAPPVAAAPGLPPAPPPPPGTPAVGQ